MAAEDGSWKAGPSEAFGIHGPPRGWQERRHENENWSWRSDSNSVRLSRGLGTSEFEGSIRDTMEVSAEGEGRNVIKVAGADAGQEKKPGRVSNTYPPIFRAKPQESYLEWKRSVEFWIGGEGTQLPVELIGPRMMVQLKDRAAQLVKHLNIADVNQANGGRR